jgi:hypothetical protein
MLDPAVYVKRVGNAFVLIGTHVDDLFVVSNAAGRPIREKLWAHLTSKLSIKTLGDAKWTLQMLIQRDVVHGVLKISQESFVTEVLRRFNMTNCKSVPTPAVNSGDEAVMLESDFPTTEAEKKEIEDLPFLELTGCLWWLAQMTRLDIFVALQRAAHYTSRPSAKLWRWLTYILKYLAGTKSMGIVYTRNTTAPPLEGYVDASFADNSERRSTAGWAFFVHGSLVAYDSQVIKRVVTSSTEAGCAALTVIGKENVWQRQMYLDATGLKSLAPTPIRGQHCDNCAHLSRSDQAQ